MEIISAYPSWFYFLCVLAGLLLAAGMYYRSDIPGVEGWLKYLLASLRALSGALLCFLLLNPFIKTEQRQLEKPILIFANDNSASVLINKDSTFYKNDFPVAYNELVNSFGEETRKEVFSFGQQVADSVSFTYADKRSNFQNLFKALEDQLLNQNLVAMVMASDGIYNAGTDPLYLCERLGIPIYTIALGDSNEQKDVKVRSFRSNSFAYLGNDFPLEVELECNGFKGSSLEVEVKEIGNKGNRVIGKKTIQAIGNSFFTTITFKDAAKERGLKHYRVSIKALANEINYSNNARDLFIEVLDTKKKVLIHAHSPHPDLRALRMALEDQGNTDVKIIFAGKENINPKDYDLVILHQLPSIDGKGTNLISELQQNEVPYWAIVGSKTNLSTFNSQQQGLKITSSRKLFNEVLPNVNEDFGLFTLSDVFKERIAKMPPMRAPFGSYKESAALYTVLSQQIGSIDAEIPLLALYDGPEGRHAYTTGEGLWNWQLAEFEEFESHDALFELVNKCLQFLTVQRDKRPFRVKLDKNIFDENEAIQLYAELYNSNYESTNEPDVSLVIRNQEGTKYNFNFGRSSERYYINAGSLPNGKYSYTASTDFNGEKRSASGSFIVRKIDFEALTTVADHQKLNRISKATGGKLFYPSQMEALKSELNKRDDLRPVAYFQKSIEELINWRWILGLIVLLLAVEWFIRKFRGAY